MSEQLPVIELTDKQKVFIEEYLVSWNATQAALKAGYSPKTARQQGSETLSKPYVQKYIQARLKEKHLTADEVLARLADQATGSMEYFLDIGPRGSTKLNLARAREAGKLHLLKSFAKGKQGTKIEIYDAQAALVHIGKHLGLFKEIHEGKLDLVNLSIDEWKVQQAMRREQAGRAAEMIEDEMCDTPSAPSS
jgi:phage terminase small subunit